MQFGAFSRFQSPPSEGPFTPDALPCRAAPRGTATQGTASGTNERLVTK